MAANFIQKSIDKIRIPNKLGVVPVLRKEDRLASSGETIWLSQSGSVCLCVSAPCLRGCGVCWGLVWGCGPARARVCVSFNAYGCAGGCRIMLRSFDNSVTVASSRCHRNVVSPIHCASRIPVYLASAIINYLFFKNDFLQQNKFFISAGG